jgi:transposase InsO family protein
MVAIIWICGRASNGASFIASDRTYGAHRVWHDMLAEGISCGLHRIERLMKAKHFALGRDGGDCRPILVDGSRPFELHPLLPLSSRLR